MVLICFALFGCAEHLYLDSAVGSTTGALDGCVDLTIDALGPVPTNALDAVPSIAASDHVVEGRSADGRQVHLSYVPRHLPAGSVVGARLLVKYDVHHRAGEIMLADPADACPH